MCQHRLQEAGHFLVKFRKLFLLMGFTRLACWVWEIRVLQYREFYWLAVIFLVAGFNNDTSTSLKVFLQQKATLNICSLKSTSKMLQGSLGPGFYFNSMSGCTTFIPGPSSHKLMAQFSKPLLCKYLLCSQKQAFVSIRCFAWFSKENVTLCWMLACITSRAQICFTVLDDHANRCFHIINLSIFLYKTLSFPELITQILCMSMLLLA